MSGPLERIAQAIRDNIKVDATGLSPAVASAFIVGIDDAARAAIAAYEAERDKRAVTDGLDFIQKTIDEAAAKTIPPASEVNALAARIRELEEALKPFADESGTWDDDIPDDQIARTCRGDGYVPVDSEFTFGDLRRARALTQKIPASASQRGS